MYFMNPIFRRARFAQYIEPLTYVNVRLLTYAAVISYYYKTFWYFWYYEMNGIIDAKTQCL